MIDEAARTVLKARERVLSLSVDHDPTAVRPEIMNSWRRSLIYGVNPDRCAPQPANAGETNGQFRRTADSVVTQRIAALAQSNSSLALTDAEGRLLERWVPDRGFAAMMDKHLLVRDVSVAEADTGTGSSSIVLETGQPVLVAGPEHFNSQWIELTCAGAPIRHPVTRRILGSLNLTVKYSDTNPFLRSWVSDVAATVEQALLTTASSHEQLLLAAYKRANRDARYAVVCLNEDTSILNAPASRLLTPIDQVMLQKIATQLLSPSGDSTTTTTTLTNGLAVCVDVAPVSDGPRPIGAVIRLKPIMRNERSSFVQLANPSSLPGLVGTSGAWQRLCDRAATVGRSPVLVVGEEGVGKLAVACALSEGDFTVIDAAVERETDDMWVADVRAACDSSTSHIIVRNVDRLPAQRARRTSEVLSRARAQQIRVSATATVATSERPLTPLLEWFDYVLEVPTLSQRIEDMPLLLDVLSKRSHTGVRWQPDAVQAMIRIHWTRNLVSLETAVRNIVTVATRESINASDLPADLRARSSRRALAGLEQAEAQAILDALHSAGGNKKDAAHALGIARSTLYRKLRVLGIDGSVTG